jgi:ribosomal protein S18 acetylase RimI-like enzyme
MTLRIVAVSARNVIFDSGGCVAPTGGKRIIRIRDARITDGDAMLALMPRLAEFDLPQGRAPAELYSDDAVLMRRWLAGELDDCLVQVAVDGSDEVVGFTLTRLRPDALSHEPSAHLEAIAVAAAAEGQGAGRALLAAVEENAAKHGARSLTLHVISTNERAITFYERAGYFGEMRRYIKRLGNV